MSIARTKILKVDPTSIVFNGDVPKISDPETTQALSEAAHLLQSTNNPVAFPTETVYGLGASALNTEAVLNIYRAKNRPADNPLILHVSSRSQIESILNVQIPAIYLPLLDKFWPGPLTILLPVPANSNISSACTVGQTTFAVRLPSNPVARALIAISNLPLAAPSANRSTMPSPTKADHVYQDLNGKIPLVLDGGSCDVGVESTVVDGLSNPPVLLRPGGVTFEDIVKTGGDAWKNLVVAKSTTKDNEIARAPGMKYKHYSPVAPVLLAQDFTKANTDALVDKIVEFVGQSEMTVKSIAILRTRQLDSLLANKLESAGFTVIDRELGTTGSQISHNLFASFRDMDSQHSDLIVIEGIDEVGEGLAVMNRVRKAALTTISP